MTQYIDLPKSNKRRRDKVAIDEERLDEVAIDEEENEHDKDMQQFPGQELLPDRWNVSEDGRLWTRVHNITRRKLYVPEPTADVRTHPLQPERATNVRRGHPNPEHIRIRDKWRMPNSKRDLHYLWTTTTCPTLRMNKALTHHIEEMDQIQIKKDILVAYLMLENLNKNHRVLKPQPRQQLQVPWTPPTTQEPMDLNLSLRNNLLNLNNHSHQ